jgi:hypothetical protein
VTFDVSDSPRKCMETVLSARVSENSLLVILAALC